MISILSLWKELTGFWCSGFLSAKMISYKGSWGILVGLFLVHNSLQKMKALHWKLNYNLYCMHKWNLLYIKTSFMCIEYLCECQPVGMKDHKILKSDFWLFFLGGIKIKNVGSAKSTFVFVLLLLCAFWENTWLYMVQKLKLLRDLCFNGIAL